MFCNIIVVQRKFVAGCVVSNAFVQLLNDADAMIKCESNLIYWVIRLMNRSNDGTMRFSEN